MKYLRKCNVIEFLFIVQSTKLLDQVTNYEYEASIPEIT